MAKGRVDMRIAFLFLVVFVSCCDCWGQSGNPARIRDVVQRLGQEVTIKGGTGQIMESLEQPGLKVFSLRDDYGDLALIRSRDQDYPIMGVTCLVTGTVHREPGHLFIDAVTKGVRPVFQHTSG